MIEKLPKFGEISHLYPFKAILEIKWLCNEIHYHKQRHY